MDKAALEARVKTAQQRFDELTQQKNDIEVELTRFQGEYRAYMGLIDQLDTQQNTEQTMQTDKKTNKKG